MKRTISYNTFICDECKSKHEKCENNYDSYPYDKHWVFLHNLSFKIKFEKINDFKEKHFCSAYCLEKYIIRKIREELINAHKES
ncbi:MAG TPA: hypothetical protein ENI61_00100 [Ignavibacteria bacterium]|nr:hypothetical protein [Ignavibacteria bacterium]